MNAEIEMETCPICQKCFCDFDCGYTAKTGSRVDAANIFKKEQHADRQRKLLERIQQNSLSTCKKKLSFFNMYFSWIKFW